MATAAGALRRLARERETAKDIMTRRESREPKKNVSSASVSSTNRLFTRSSPMSSIRTRFCFAARPWPTCSLAPVASKAAHRAALTKARGHAFNERGLEDAVLYDELGSVKHVPTRVDETDSPLRIF